MPIPKPLGGKYLCKEILFAPFGSAYDADASAQIYDTIGTFPGGTLRDGQNDNVYITGIAPIDMAYLMEAKAVLISLGTGNMYAGFYSNYATVGEDYDEHSDSIATAAIAVTINDITEVDVLNL